jgi:hypothetical protein
MQWHTLERGFDGTKLFAYAAKTQLMRVVVVCLTKQE